MADYAEFARYAQLYPEDALQEASFARLVWDASREVDNLTTGVDGVRKLKVAYPTDEDDAECVTRCVCAVVHDLYQIEQAQAAASYTTKEDGTVSPRAVSSISAGNESISYANSGKSAYTEAATDATARKALVRGTIERYLSGVCDANGVRLLYMGVYPVRPT